MVPRTDLGHPKLPQRDVFGGLTDLKGSPDPLELLI
jgi:hypothetical protein